MLIVHNGLLYTLIEMIASSFLYMDCTTRSSPSITFKVQDNIFAKVFFLQGFTSFILNPPHILRPERQELGSRRSLSHSSTFPVQSIIRLMQFRWASVVKLVGQYFLLHFWFLNVHLTLLYVIESPLIMVFGVKWEEGKKNFVHFATEHCTGLSHLWLH